MEPSETGKKKVRRKHKNSHAREVALQGLYQIDIAGIPVSGVLNLKWLNELPGAAETERIKKIIEGVSENQQNLDEVIDAFSNKDGTQISTIVRCILRMGILEIMEGSLPGSVIIDDLLDLTRRYDGDQSVGFVNGILDGFCREKERREKK